MQSIKKNMLLNCIRTGMSVLFPFIVFQYASRIILADNLGKVNFSSSIVNYFILFAGLGISSYAIRESGKYRNNKIEFERFASEVFAINVISTILSYGLLFIVVFFSYKLQEYTLLIIIQSASAFFTTIGVDWINIIYEDYRYITIRTIVFQSLTLILTIIFVRKVEDYLIFVVITIIGKIGTDILNYIYIRRKYCRVRLSFSNKLLRHLKPILIIFFNTLVISIYVNFDTTMIGILCDDTQVGYYSVAVKIYLAINTVFSAIISVTVSRISLYLASDDEKAADKLIGNMVNGFIITVLPLIVLVIVLSNNIVFILFGKIYAPAIVPLQILCLGVIFAVFASTITNCIFLSRGLERYSLIATTISAITNFSLNFVFIKLLGITGAAVTTVIAELTVFAIATFFLAKNKLTFFKMIKKANIICTLILCSLIIVFSIILPNFVHNIYFQTSLLMILTGILFILLFNKQIFKLINKKKQ